MGLFGWGLILGKNGSKVDVFSILNNYLEAALFGGFLLGRSRYRFRWRWVRWVIPKQIQVSNTGCPSII